MRKARLIVTFCISILMLSAFSCSKKSDLHFLRFSMDSNSVESVMQKLDKSGTLLEKQKQDLQRIEIWYSYPKYEPKAAYNRYESASDVDYGMSNDSLYQKEKENMDILIDKITRYAKEKLDSSVSVVKFECKNSICLMDTDLELNNNEILIIIRTK